MYRRMIVRGLTVRESMEIKGYVGTFVLQNKMLIYNLYGLSVVIVISSYLKWYVEVDDIRIYGGLVAAYMIIMAFVYSGIIFMYLGMRRLNRDYKSYSCSISNVME